MLDQLLQLFTQGGNTSMMAESLAAMADPGGLDQMIQAAATPQGISPSMIPGQDMMLVTPPSAAQAIPQVPNPMSWDSIVSPAGRAVAAAGATPPAPTSPGLTQEQMLALAKLALPQQQQLQQRQAPAAPPPVTPGPKPPGNAMLQAPLAGGRPPTLAQLIYNRR